MTRIACVGITVQDRIYSLPTLPEGGGKYQANHYLEIGGGPAATAAVAADILTPVRRNQRSSLISMANGLSLIIQVLISVLMPNG